MLIARIEAALYFSVQAEGSGRWQNALFINKFTPMAAATLKF